MKYVGKLCALLLCACTFAAPASALDKFRVAAPSTFTIENMILSSAQARGKFAEAGIDLEVIAKGDEELVTQRLGADDIDAHVYLTPGWYATRRGVLCTTMVMPLSWRFYGAIVATTPNWKDLVGGTLAISGYENFITHVVIDVLKAHGVPRARLQIVNVRGFTEPRIGAMLLTEGLATSVASDPLLEYIRRTQGVYVLADVGAYPIVSTGLFVKCSDKDNSKKWGRDRRVVGVLANEIEWILDTRSEASLIAWAENILTKNGYEEKYRTRYAGRPVASADENPAKSMVDRMRNLLQSTVPSKADMEKSAHVLFGTVPKDFAKNYYDFSLVPKDFTAVPK